MSIRTVVLLDLLHKMVFTGNLLHKMVFESMLVVTFTVLVAGVGDAVECAGGQAP